MSRIKPSHIFWFALVAGVVLRMAVIFQPESNLLTRWGSDDLYYYSQIAGHVANGDGFTFDGIHATNGFQPLFLFVLVPFGSFMLHDWYAAWIIVSLVVTLISVLAFFQLRKLSDEMGWSSWMSVILPAVFFLHPKILSVTLNGTEGALSFLMLVMSFRAFLWMQKGERFWQSTLIFSLLVITRMEFSLLLFLLFLFAMWKRHSFVQWMKVAVGPVVLFSSWLLINFLSFGNIMPSSGRAKAIHATWYEFPLLDGLKGVIGTVFYAESALSFVVVGLVLIGGYSILRSKMKSVLELSGFLLIASSILVMLTLIQLHGFRDWYLMPQYLLMLLLLSFGIEWFLISKKKYVLVLPLFVVMLWGEAQFAPRTFNGPFVVKSCERVDELLFKGEKVGAFNAGLVSTCLGENHAVVNLDGVVNNDVLYYLKNKKLEYYLKHESISYALDNDGSLNFFHENAAENQTFENIVVQEDNEVKYYSLVSTKNWR